jgi:hypothetical protein
VPLATAEGHRKGDELRMIKWRIVTVTSLLIWFVALSEGTSAENPLRHMLEKSWGAYLEACKSGKESQLEKTMSSFRLETMKGNLASAKRSLTPELIKSIAEDGPDISGAEFITLLENGPTAGLVYVKDSVEKDAAGKPRVTFIFIKFVKEDSEWKVDGAMNIGSPKFRDDGKKAEFDQSDLPPTFEIDGQVREAPKPIKVPDISAFLDIFCPGYKIQVTVNDVEQAATINKSYSGLLKGGLRKGKNSVAIFVEKTEKDAAFQPRVTIRRILEDRKTEEVFKFEPKEKIEGRHSFAFTIDK